MGEDLFDTVPEFSLLESNIDELLGYSIRRLCLEDPENLLRSTVYAQPALYMVNALQYYKAVREGDKPGFLAGHSLGEYNALLAAGVFDLITGLRLVQKRSELIANARSGSMAVVIGLDPLRVTELLRSNHASLDVASYNSPSQTAIAGPTSHILRAGADFERAGGMYLPLDINIAFHSRYLHAAAETFAQFMESFRFSPPHLPVISNVTAEPYPCDSLPAIKLLLRQHITHAVNWVDTMRYLMNAGATLFKEIGPGDALARLCRQFQH
jgi:trans-AT polyketide synthase/acyltransferase/oxidoreductase domain-containing protein/rhizoxin biosynthesis acyltransferase